MKTETEIAKYNIELINEIHIDMDTRNYICKEHLSSCQRFLKFLEVYYERYGKVWEGSCSINGMLRTEACGDILDKITDIQNAIKIYEKAGVK